MTVERRWLGVYQDDMFLRVKFCGIIFGHDGRMLWTVALWVTMSVAQSFEKTEAVSLPRSSSK